ncbi:hypothetical protein [Paenibacillus timonensis]|uniref:hypothetical protein n=1 Tax=Paenibacillus timonensis TaxID=225915 RepID=UPI003F9E34AF
MKKIGVILLLGTMLTLAACGAQNNDMNKENMNDGANASTEMSGTAGNSEMKDDGMSEDMMGDEMKDGEMKDGNMGDQEMTDSEMGK